MARTTKLLAMANNVSLIRNSNLQGAQRRYTNQVATALKLEHGDHEVEYEENEHVQYKMQSDHKLRVDMNWVPHPKSGIYFPQGHDWVMNDVPYNAATLGQGQTYWLRNIDGVDKHNPDFATADQYFLAPYHA